MGEYKQTIKIDWNVERKVNNTMLSNDDVVEILNKII